MSTFKYLPQYFSTTLNVGGGIDASQTTGIVLLSVSGVDITKPGQICISYSDPLNTGVAEWINYTSINGSNELVGVTRGCEGYSAHTHLPGAVIQFTLSATHLNDLADVVNGIKAKDLITTAGGTTTYTLTPTPAVGAYVTGQEFNIKMNATNTGASTINVSGLGAKSLTKGGATALSSGDLLINATYTIVYDGTQFQVMGISAAAASIATAAEVTTGTDNAKMVTPLAAQGLGGADGWKLDANTWTYSSADGATGIVTINADLTGAIQAGDRIKLTQTTPKYFIVTKTPTYGAGNTTLTFWGGTDYTLANAAITLPYYSHAKSPFGFNTDPTKWRVQVTDTTQRSQASPVASTWYNLGSNTISVPIGTWNLEFVGYIQLNKTASVNDLFMTLSTANNTESDSDLTYRLTIYGDFTGNTGQKNKILTTTSKTSYYLNEKTDQASGTNLLLRSDLVKTIINANCAFL